MCVQIGESEKREHEAGRAADRRYADREADRRGARECAQIGESEKREHEADRRYADREADRRHAGREADRRCAGSGNRA